VARLLNRIQLAFVCAAHLIMEQLKPHSLPAALLCSMAVCLGTSDMAKLLYLINLDGELTELLQSNYKRFWFYSDLSL